MKASLRGISSMATRQLLARLCEAWEAREGAAVAMESVGGVDAARRVQSGEPFDIVVLASDAIDKLIESGKALGGSKVDIVRSGVAIAVKAGAASPDISSQAALKQTVLAAPSIGYSTGPSGTALLKLIDRWGITGQVKGRLMQSPPGVPVGSMVAKGDVALGFQQLSELMNLQGITVVGAMPPGTEIITTFSGAVCTSSQLAQEARRLLAFMASPDTAQTKRSEGMEPA